MATAWMISRLERPASLADWRMMGASTSPCSRGRLRLFGQAGVRLSAQSLTILPTSFGQQTGVAFGNSLAAGVSMVTVATELVVGVPLPMDLAAGHLPV